jgi:hypothetical protein
VNPSADSTQDLLTELFGLLLAECPPWCQETVEDLLAAGQLQASVEVLASWLEGVSQCGSSGLWGLLPGLVALHELADALGVSAQCLQTLKVAAAQRSLLTTRAGHRPGGRGQGERFFTDLVVDGQGLGLRFGDFIPPFGWLPEAVQRGFRDGLAGKGTEVLAGRTPLCVCPECADLGCGCLSVQVKLFHDVVEWWNLGWQSPFDETYTPLIPEAATDRPWSSAAPSFRFERDAYFAALCRLV